MSDRIQETIDRLVAEAPPLSRGQRALLAAIFTDEPIPADLKRVVPDPITLHDPPANALYSTRCRASRGACERCGAVGKRMVDHCHEHNRVRGLVCLTCNNTKELRHGVAWLAKCEQCRIIAGVRYTSEPK